jgi:hypothetical protein
LAPPPPPSFSPWADPILPGRAVPCTRVSHRRPWCSQADWCHKSWSGRGRQRPCPCRGSQERPRSTRGWGQACTPGHHWQPRPWGTAKPRPALPLGLAGVRPTVWRHSQGRQVWMCGCVVACTCACVRQAHSCGDLASVGGEAHAFRQSFRRYIPSPLATRLNAQGRVAPDKAGVPTSHPCFGTATASAVTADPTPTK